MADRRLRAVGDDEVVARRAVLGEDAADLRLQHLAGQGLAVERHRAVRCLGPAEHLLRRAHARLRRLLRPADPLQLRLVLHAAAIGEVRVVRIEGDAVLAQEVCGRDGERPRNGRLVDAELTTCVDIELVPDDLVARQALLEQLVVPDLFPCVGLDACFGEPLDLEGGREGVALAVLLRVEERVGNDDRHLVAHLRGHD